MATVKWNADGDGADWHDGDNWDGDAVPTSADDVVIDDTNVAANQHINCDSAIEYNTLSISSASYTHELDLNAAATGGNFTVGSGGNVKGGASITLTCSGNIDWSGQTDTYEWDDITVDLTGTGTIEMPSGSTWFFMPYKIKCAAAGEVTTADGDVSVWTGFLEIGTGELTSDYQESVLVTASGDPFVDGGGTLSCFKFIYRCVTCNVVGRDYTGCTELNIYPSGGDDAQTYYDATMTGNVQASVVRIFCNQYGAEDNGCARLLTNGHTLTCTGLEVGASQIYYYGAIKCGSSTINVNGNVTTYQSDSNSHMDMDTSTWNVTGDWINTVDIEFQADTSTVNLTGTGDLKHNSTGWEAAKFYNLSIGADGQTTTLYDTINIKTNGSLTIHANGVVDGQSSVGLGVYGSLVNSPVASNFSNLTRFAYYTGSLSPKGGNYTGATELRFQAWEDPGGEQIKTLQGDVVCNLLTILNGGDPALSTLDTDGYDITATGLILGSTTDGYGYGKLICRDSTVDINGNISLGNDAADNIIQMDSSTWTISGNITLPWADNLVAGTSSVTLDGTSQVLNGTLIFHNLTKIVASADTLTVVNGSLIAVTNNLTLGGADGELLTLESDSAGDQFSLNAYHGTVPVLEYIDVKDCDASYSGSRTLDLDKSVNSGNNSNLTFDAKSMTSH